MSAKKTVEEEVMQEVADELQLPFSFVKDVVVNGQSAFTAYVMKSRTFDSVRWPRFGIFEVKPWQLVIESYKKGLSKIQREIFNHQIKNGNAVPIIPRWVIKKGKLSNYQKELLRKYGDKVVR